MSSDTSQDSIPRGFGLREYGIYQLPDGIEVIVCPISDGITPLFFLSDWERYGEVAIRTEEHSPAFRIYQIDESGRVVRLGQPTKWFSYDLLDTGRTVSPAADAE
jgi:hypothetical protein